MRREIDCCKSSRTPPASCSSKHTPLAVLLFWDHPSIPGCLHSVSLAPDCRQEVFPKGAPRAPSCLACGRLFGWQRLAFGQFGIWLRMGKNVTRPGNLTNRSVDPTLDVVLVSTARRQLHVISQRLGYLFPASPLAPDCCDTDSPRTAPPRLCGRAAQDRAEALCTPPFLTKATLHQHPLGIPPVRHP